MIFSNESDLTACFGQSDEVREPVQHFSREVLLLFEGGERKQIERALNLAVDIHQEQTRIDDAPYITHLLSVACRVALDFGIRDSNVICVALLHDSVEDQWEKLSRLGEAPFSTKRESQSAALKYIEKAFGSEVSIAIEKLSNPIDLSRRAEKIARKRGGELTEIKNQLYLEHIREATSSNEIAFIVKLSDFWDNFGALGAVEPGKRQKLEAKYLPVRDYFRDSLTQLDDSHALRDVGTRLASEIGELYE